MRGTSSDGLGAFHMVGADGEAVDFVTQALAAQQRGSVDRQGQLAPLKR
jgi:hypothetical protein